MDDRKAEDDVPPVSHSDTASEGDPDATSTNSGCPAETGPAPATAEEPTEAEPSAAVQSGSGVKAKVAGESAILKRRRPSSARKADASSIPGGAAAQIPLPVGSLIGSAGPPLTRLYLLTNRGNLLHILSSGTVTPREGYAKYYPDPGDLCPGRVLLLAQPPSHAMIEATTPERPGQFPVLLEVDTGSLRGEVTVIDGSLNVLDSVTTPGRDALALLVRGAIPVGSVVCCHFRSAVEQRRLETASYSTVSLEELHLPLSVTPSLFDGPAVDVEAFRKVVSEACQATGQAGPIPWRRADALGGSILLLTKLFTGDARQAPAGLQHCLTALTGSQDSALSASPARAPSHVAYLGALLPHLLVGSAGSLEEGFTPRLSRIMTPRAADQLGGTRLASSLIFLAASAHLADMVPEEYSRDRLLEDVPGLVRMAAVALFPGTVEGLVAHCGNLFAAVRSVTELSLLMSDFPFADDAVGAGLLRFLLQPQPEAALDFSAGGPLDSRDSVAVSALLTGLLHGRARIPTSCRPSREALAFVDSSLAWRLNRSLSAPDWSGMAHRPAVELRVVERGRTCILSAGGIAILRRQTPEEQPEPEPTSAIAPPAPPDRVKEKKRAPLPELETLSSAVEEQREPESDVLPVAPSPSLPEPSAGTAPQPDTTSPALLPAPVPAPDTGTGRVAGLRRRLRESDLTDSTERDAAITLCREVGWEDCLTTILPLEGRRFLLTNNEGRLQLRVRGAWLHTASIEVRQAEFRRHLESGDWELVPADVVEAVARLLREE